MTNKESFIQFPCDFPLKIIGKKTTHFAPEIREIIRKHFPDTTEEVIDCQESKQSNYLSISVRVYVHDQQALDALYQELTKHPDIKMVL